MMIKSSWPRALGGLAALILPIGFINNADAAEPVQQHVVRMVSDEYVAPLQFAIGNGGFYVVDSATDTLTVVGRSAPIPTTGTYLDGVAVDPSTRAVAYLSRTEDGYTALVIAEPGQAPVIADLSGYEAKWNPDKINHYGAVNPSRWASCVGGRWPTNQSSGTDSRPAAVTALGHGRWAVADKSGNDVLKVNRAGVVTLLALLPPQRVVFTATMAAQYRLPSCVAGLAYDVPADPTDVEVSADGRVYATTTGWPADDAGSVYDVTSRTSPSRVATGFHRPTNLALDDTGGVYVAEPITGTISAAIGGTRVPVAMVPAVAGLEYAYQHLYASTAPSSYGTSPDPGEILLLAPVRP